MLERDVPISSHENSDPEGPASWWAALLGATPLLLFGMVYILYAADRLINIRFLRFHSVRIELQLLYLLMIVGLGAGLLKRSPRWSYSYLGMVLYMAWMHDQPIDDQPLYFPYGGGIMFSYWVPLVIMLVVVLFVKRSLDPLLNFLREIWNDWTRLSFTLFAAILPLFTIVFLDSDWGMTHLLGLIFNIFVLCLGAIAYLRASSTWRRALSLQAALLLITLEGVIVSDWFGVSSGGEANVNYLTLIPWLLIWCLLMFIPGLLGLLRRGLAFRGTLR